MCAQGSLCNRKGKLMLVVVVLAVLVLLFAHARDSCARSSLTDFVNVIWMGVSTSTPSPFFRPLQRSRKSPGAYTADVHWLRIPRRSSRTGLFLASATNCRSMEGDGYTSKITPQCFHIRAKASLWDRIRVGFNPLISFSGHLSVARTTAEWIERYVYGQARPRRLPDVSFSSFAFRQIKIAVLVV